MIYLDDEYENCKNNLANKRLYEIPVECKEWSYIRTANLNSSHEKLNKSHNSWSVLMFHVLLTNTSQQTSFNPISQMR